MEEIKVKYLNDKVERIKPICNGDWIDLRAATSIHLTKGECALIPLGVAMQLPAGYEAILAPRSSSFKKWGIIQTNSIGVIDESYNGDNDQWLMSVIATRDADIELNDRVCQFRIIKHQPEIAFVEVTTLGNEDRGGFGSTGTK